MHSSYGIHFKIGVQITLNLSNDIFHTLLQVRVVISRHALSTWLRRRESTFKAATPDERDDAQRRSTEQEEEEGQGGSPGDAVTYDNANGLEKHGRI